MPSIPLLPIDVDGDPRRTTTLYGVAITLIPDDTSLKFEVQRAPDSSGSPGTWGTVAVVGPFPRSGGTYQDPRPYTGAVWWYRARHVGIGVDAGAWSSPVSSAPYSIRKEITDGWRGRGSPVYPIHRGEVLTDGKFTPRADNAAGTTISQNVVQNDGQALRSLAKGHVGGDHRHNAVISFPTGDFENPPLIIFQPGGIGDQPESKWGTLGEVNADDGSANDAPAAATRQYDVVAADDLTVGGFRLVALKMQKGTPVAQFDNFAGTDLDTLGEADTVTLNGNTVGAPSADNKYVVRFGADADITSGPGEDAALHVRIAIETNADGAGWEERRVVDFFCTADGGSQPGSNTENYVEEITVSGLDNDDQLRLLIKSIDLVGAGAVLDQLAVTGRTDNTGVTFNTDSGVKYANKTPDAGDTIPWEALAVS